jgi:hypothetical protein
MTPQALHETAKIAWSLRVATQETKLLREQVSLTAQKMDEASTRLHETIIAAHELKRAADNLKKSAEKELAILKEWNFLCLVTASKPAELFQQFEKQVDVEGKYGSHFEIVRNKMCSE